MSVEWWCLTEGEPSTFRCRERGHDVLDVGWIAAQSTSARLRETQQALAASQADLTRVGRERDGVREELARQAADNDDLRATLAMRAGQLTAARRHVNEAVEAEDLALDRAARFKRERDLARAELASVDEAAGRDIAAPDEPLVDRVADLLRGRTEATQRALELAAELASARQELAQLRKDSPPLPAGDREENRHA